ncbi:mycofactocin system transcriptional regulator [Microbacterium gorillae]|uniref:mycofactocin system transcriptional regulator n=1 Tax=Microbacterium gorillae TaxID=1231063 RepID=UPI00059047CB|nr:mycofactocin system transcriptional regulator [Microbacterium gorillae]
MSADPARTSARHGRPEATSHAEIERVAFALFAEHGFDGTTLEDIARAVGVGRRTLFRYFESKNDIPWGEFDQTLDSFRAILRGMPADATIAEALERGVAEFNHFPADADPPHEQRMRLIMDTPTLQAHSAVRYAAWRRVVADFVAERAGGSPEDPLPNLIGHVSLAVARSAYDEWIRDPARDLPALVAQQFRAAREFFA